MESEYGCACRWSADKGQVKECGTHAKMRQCNRGLHVKCGHCASNPEVERLTEERDGARVALMRARDRLAAKDVLSAAERHTLGLLDEACTEAEVANAYRELRAEVTRLTEERDRALRMQKIAEGFHDVAVKERDLERLRVERLKSAQAEIGRQFLRAIEDNKADAKKLAYALEWMTNVACGVGKDGHPPLRDEYDAAIDSAKAALAAHEAKR